MVIDVKVSLSKVSLSKATGHATLTFQNYRLENKLLQELGPEIFVIISNTVQQKFSPLIKFIWEDQHQLEFVTIIAQKSATVYPLH